MSDQIDTQNEEGLPPRWLDAAQQRTWRALVRLTLELPTALDRPLQQGAGIGHTYYLILAMLSEAPGREMRMRELARATSGSQSRLSHAMGSLEARGWVSRRNATDDRRGQIAQLSEAGWEQLQALAPTHVASVQALVFEKLTPSQVENLAEILEALQEGLPWGGDAEVVGASEEVRGTVSRGETDCPASPPGPAPSRKRTRSADTQL